MGMYLFKNEGPENTKKVVDLSVERAKKDDIDNVVVSSNSGESALLFIGSGIKNVVCVTRCVGFKEPGIHELKEENKKKLLENGIKIFTGTHLFRGVEKAIISKAGGMYPSELIANALRLFGQGTKVAVEIAVMALDAGLIPYGERIISIGGTKNGLDTSLIITPQHASNFFETKIHEIICKPGF